MSNKIYPIEKIMTILLKGLFFSAIFIFAANYSAFPQTTQSGQTSANKTATVSGKTFEDKSKEVDELLGKTFSGESPGAAVLVVRDGRILHKKGYGLANLETKRKIEPDTIFDLASVSKQFTAMTILILSERGKLKLDDSLAKFFPEFPAYAEKITVRQLLNHTSGLPDYMEIFLKAGKIDAEGKPGGFEPSSADTVKLLAEQKQLRFEPGTKWEYSNSGYVVLAMIAEKASGTAFPQFVKKNIFEPLGMNDSVVFDQTNPKIKNRATSYARGSGEKSFENIDYTPLNLIYGDGAVNTNLEDMFKWDQALYTEKLVKAATLKQAFARGKLNDGKEIDYGFGWFPRLVFGLESVSHTGGWAGFRTYIVRYPAERFSVVVLSNFAQFSPGTIGNKIARIYLQDKMTFPVAVKLDDKTLEKYAGRYELSPNVVWEIKHENGALIAKTPSQTLKLLPESETKFFVENSEDIKITFQFDDKGAVSRFAIFQSIERFARKL